MTARATDPHLKVVRRRFGHTRGVTPALARERADDLDAKAAEAPDPAVADQMERDAEALREWAADQDNQLDDTPSTDGATPSPSKSSGRKRSTGGTASRSGGKLGRAVDRVVSDQPQDMAAGAVVSGGAMFWRIVGGTLLLVLVYHLLVRGARAAELIGQLRTVTHRVRYPKGAFPNGPPRHRRTGKVPL